MFFYRIGHFMTSSNIPKSILIATGNKGKIREFEQLLLPLNILLVKLDELPFIAEPEETGTTFHDNAKLKAEYYATRSGLWSMADDSGLEIDHLKGAPGVLSARYGGADASYSEKMRLVLDKLASTTESERSAQFVSVIALADPSGTVRLIAEGVCRGSIADAPRGTHGFGYDPIFLPAGFDRTFGEMNDEEKQSLSHRGKASIQFIRKMSDFTGV